MSEHVGHTVPETVYEAGPADRWHAEYDSFREWLDTEAPPTPAIVKKRNAPRYRVIRRRT